MEEKRRIEEELNSLRDLQLLAQAHEEVSTIRMRLARGSVLATRDFLDSLSAVFVNVKSAYKKHIIEELNKKKNQNTQTRNTISQKNGKEIYVFLSANNKLYGDVIPKIFELFRQACQKKDADIAIVGKLGKEMFEVSDIKRPYTYFEIADSQKGIDEMKPLITYILPYEKISIFYGKFINVVTQNASVSNITGDESLESEKPQENTSKEFSFIFEPSIEKVMSFFESQTFFSLFKQTMHEAELARYGSRIKAMEQALETINKQIDILTVSERRARNLLTNKKQLERIAGISLWK